MIQIPMTPNGIINGQTQNFVLKIVKINWKYIVYLCPTIKKSKIFLFRYFSFNFYSIFNSYFQFFWIK